MPRTGDYINIFRLEMIPCPYNPPAHGVNHINYPVITSEIGGKICDNPTLLYYHVNYLMICLNISPAECINRLLGISNYEYLTRRKLYPAPICFMFSLYLSKIQDYLILQWVCILKFINKNRLKMIFH